MLTIINPLFDSPRWRFVPYAVAIGACAFAVLAQLIVSSYMPPPPPLLFYPAVLVVASFGGLGPAVFAVCLSSISMTYWFLPPQASLERSAEVLDIGIFIALSLIVAALMARAREAMRAAEWAWGEAEAARASLKQAFRAREEMLAIVSHDLRTPLHLDRAILGTDDAFVDVVEGRARAGLWPTYPAGGAPHGVART